MSTPDDALVELIARAAYTAVMADEESDDFEPMAWEQQSTPRDREHYRRLAEAVLSALRDAGALAPEGARVVWGWRFPDGDRWRGAEPTEADIRRQLNFPDTVVGCRVVGPWVEVPDGT